MNNTNIKKKVVKTKVINKNTKCNKKNKPKKENQYEIKLSIEFIEELKKYNVKDVFRLHSNIKNKDIINGLIYMHKIIVYKCHSEKCSIEGEWLDNPLELLLINKNNKEDDNRIANLTYSCYNCYFQNISDKSIFQKVKKEKI